MAYYWRVMGKGYDGTAKRTACAMNVECNNKMVRNNNEDRRRTNRWFPEDRGQRIYVR